MELYDVIIIGSGPAGTFSALGLEGKRTLMLDVGYTPEKSPAISGNINKLRSNNDDLFNSLIGKDFESLHNLYLDKISYKLKAPHQSYILKNWQKLSPVKAKTFEPMMSFASGGLANAWGAGSYEFNDIDLTNFPINLKDLEPYYKEITKHIGISGENDDLSSSFGNSNHLLPPLKKSEFSQSFIRKYKKLKNRGHLKHIKVGSPRLAILSRPLKDRTAYLYDNLDFFKSYNPAVYNPVFTLNKIIERDNCFEYRNNYLVSSYKEHSNYVEVKAKNLKNNQINYFKARKIIIAAGALNTTKIVLASKNDYHSKLPIMDNPMVCMPIVDYKLIGSKIGKYDAPIAQLNLIYDDKSGYGPIQASLYGSSGPLRTDITFNFPFTVKDNLKMTNYLAPASGLMMVFLPGHKSKSNYIKLNKDQSLEITYKEKEKEKEKIIIKKIIKVFHQMKYICFNSLIQYPRIGNSLHYAGMLPMKEEPSEYQTNKFGKLFGSKNIYIVDGSCFSELPAKNLTFTIMANSLRIARYIKKEI